MIRKTLAHYVIASQLGKGGMGEVYHFLELQESNSQGASLRAHEQIKKPRRGMLACMARAKIDFISLSQCQ
jgi:hypothetical protein